MCICAYIYIVYHCKGSAFLCVYCAVCAVCECMWCMSWVTYALLYVWGVSCRGSCLSCAGVLKYIRHWSFIFLFAASLFCVLGETCCMPSGSLYFQVGFMMVWFPVVFILCTCVSHDGDVTFLCVSMRINTISGMSWSRVGVNWGPMGRCRRIWNFIAAVYGLLASVATSAPNLFNRTCSRDAVFFPCYRWLVPRLQK